ncbi:MAG: PAS domain-containing protein [Nitrospirota bacterium]|nr:MAG: PAS domain-containing protein [Nitrospirota bacterium]
MMVSKRKWPLLIPFIAIAVFPAEAFSAEANAPVDSGGFLFLFISVIALLFLGILYMIRIAMKAYRSNKMSGSGKNSQVGFMASTFQELVQKLKEKENELQELRRIAEERAESMESYNENILQSVPSGVVSFDKDHNMTSMNTSGEKILGLDAKHCIGKPYDEIFNKQISRIISDNQSLLREEVIYETPSHSRLWLGMTISPLNDNQGQPIGKIIIFTDLTDLKALESQVRLRENLSSLGEMSAGIAHELRNPMAVIAGHTKMLSKKVPDEMRASVEEINNEIRMMDRIISDFMSFAHPLNLNRTSIDPDEMIRDIIRTISEEKEGIEIIVNLSKCRIDADETLLRQVFSNLIQNAMDAMIEGGKLTISSKRVDSKCQIEIRDYGHGISDEIRSKIFLPFYTTKEKGTGLGLAIVHKIIVSHGGSISFESSQDGTAFRLILPQYKESS